ncbi:MAG TPA: hypothetical protein DDZ55_10925 [Firmicutes bacterium]|nr:hypothetical protein [Bacillota bacterium]
MFSNSLTPALILILLETITHGWANAFVPFFPIIIMDKQATQTRFWLWVSLTFVLGVVTMAIREKTQIKAVVKTEHTAPDSAGSF